MQTFPPPGSLPLFSNACDGFRLNARSLISLARMLSGYRRLKDDLPNPDQKFDDFKALKLEIGRSTSRNYPTDPLHSLRASKSVDRYF